MYKHFYTYILTLSLIQITVSAEQLRVYFGTKQSEGIYTATLDTKTGNLSTISLAAAIQAPSFLTVHPSRAFLYSTSASFNRPNTGGIAAFKIENDGTLSKLNEQSSQGRGACHLSTDASGQSLITANYNSGTVGAFQIHDDGSLSPAISTHQHTGSARHPKRQKAPHPHSAFIHPNNQFAYVPDLGIDKVMIYSLAPEAGTLTPAGHAEVPGGSQGPRHMKFSKNGSHAYVLNELSLTLAIFSVDQDNGQLDYISTHSVFIEGKEQEFGTMTCAEIRIHPNGKWLITSTRDLNGLGRDTLSTFKINTDGGVELISNTAAAVHFPRNFNIDPTGNWLIAAGQKSSTLAIFSFNKKTGTLTLKKNNIPFQGQPTCVEFLQ